MAILPRQQILRIHAAVVSARLSANRAPLLGGIEETFVASLSTAADPAGQILSDLHALNQAERLADGSVPLRIWIENAIALAGKGEAVTVLRQALEATRYVGTQQFAAVPEPAPAAPPPPAAPPVQPRPEQPSSPGYPRVQAPVPWTLG